MVEHDGHVGQLLKKLDDLGIATTTLVVYTTDNGALRDLASEGFVGGLARKHIGYMGYTMQLKAMYEGTAPEIANEIDRGSRADVVVLTGGCPNVCHRTVVAVQREIEMRGIPTVLITVSPEVSAQMRPPRAASRRSRAGRCRTSEPAAVPGSPCPHPAAPEGSIS